MTAAEVETHMEANSMGGPNQEKMLSIMNFSQRGRMEEQRCTLVPCKSAPASPGQMRFGSTGPASDEFFSVLDSIQGQRLDDQRVSLAALPGFGHQGPMIKKQRSSAPQIILTKGSPGTDGKLLSVHSPQGLSQHDPSSEIQVATPAEQDKFMTMISHGQRGRMEEQRCVLGVSRSTPSTPRRTEEHTATENTTTPDADKFFSLLANTQGRRLDDQRVALPLLPGTQNGGSTSTAGGQDSSYLCYMVSKVQGSRMEEQRCSLPQTLSHGSLSSQRKDPSDSGVGPSRSASFNPRSDVERPNQKQLTPAEQECTPSTPKYKRSGSIAPTGPDADKFFSLLTNTQGRRLDDQRASLPLLSGVQNGGSTSTAGGQDSSYLCYMVSKVQGSRMEEQRCSLPQTLSHGSLSSQRKDPSDSGVGPSRSAPFNPRSDVERPNQKQLTPAEQECTPSTPKYKRSGSIAPTGPDADKFFSLLSNTQGRRLDDQRASLPLLSGVQNGGSTSTAGGQDSSYLSYMVSKVQGSRMEEQRCSLPQTLSHGSLSSQRKDPSDSGVGPSRSAPFNPRSDVERPNQKQLTPAEQECTPSTPKYKRSGSIAPTGPDADKFFSLLSNTQGRRLDDQRASLPLLSGVQNGGSTSTAGGQDSSYLSYMVSKVQGSRMEEQRCSLPQTLSHGSLSSQRKDPSDSGVGPSRSAPFNPRSDVERPNQKQLTPAEQECTPSTPKYKRSGSIAPTGPDADKFFSLLSNTQSRRLDDQRASLPLLPRVQNGGSTSTAGGQDSSYLCYMVSKVQGSRMDEQRCSAPHILQNLGTPSAQWKAQRASEKPTLTAHGQNPSDKPPQRPLSFSCAKTNQPQQEAAPAEQEQFLKFMCHAQSGRIEEQRCTLDPSRSTPATPKHNGSAGGTTQTDPEAFFRFLASSQGQRLDDQRVALQPLPGISGNSDPQLKGAYAKKQGPAPQIILTEGTPAASRKAYPRPASPPRTMCTESGSPKVPPRSASFSPTTEYQKMPNSPAQMNVRVTMTFTSQQGRKNVSQPGPFPEVFLTLGAPGEAFVVPLSPSPGRPLSLNLNLVPKEGSNTRSLSPSHASPRKARSRSLSPNPGACNKPLPMPQSPHRDAMKKHVTSPISPDEDYFSFIQKVHTAQLQGIGQGGDKGKTESGKGKGKGEQGKGKGKGGRKYSKDGGKKR